MSYGLAIIFFAWLWQAYIFYRRGHRSFDPWFLRLSFLGILLVAVDSFNLSLWLSWFPLGTTIVLLWFIWRYRR